MDTVRNTSTEIKSREEFAEFSAIVDSLESNPPELEELNMRADEACLALRGQLDAELGREVGICSGRDTVAVEPTGTSFTPAGPPCRTRPRLKRTEKR